MTADTNAFRSLGPTADVVDGEILPHYLEDLKRRVGVTRVDGRLYAFDELCTVEPACPLSAGLLTGTTVMCQCDGSQFDIASGAVLRGPATVPLRTYEVRDEAGEIRLDA